MENDKIFSNDSRFHCEFQKFPQFPFTFSLYRTYDIDFNYNFRQSINQIRSRSHCYPYMNKIWNRNALRKLSEPSRDNVEQRMRRLQNCETWAEIFMWEKIFMWERRERVVVQSSLSTHDRSYQHAWRHETLWERWISMLSFTDLDYHKREKANKMKMCNNILTKC